MVPIVLSLKDKNILIVGGGKVALRKIKLFLKEEANITVVAPEILDDIKKLDVKCVTKKYSPLLLNNKFLVYAATNHEEINNKIIEDCNKRNILCGNAYSSDDVSFHSMSYRENDLGMIGLYMGGRLPYNKPILNKLMNVLELNSEKIDLLEKLRPYIIKTPYNSKDYYEKLYKCPTRLLNFLYCSNKEKEGIIFIGKSYVKEMNFHLKNSITLTYKEFNKYKELFIFEVDYKVMPLYLKDSKHYKDLISNIEGFSNYGPILRDEEDLKEIMKLFKSDRKTIFISYPEVKKAFPKLEIYSSDDSLNLRNGKYLIVLLLVSKGELYDKIIKEIESNNRKKVGITVKELMNEEKFIDYLEKRVKEKATE